MKPCDQIDDFLSGALSAESRAAFAAHLSGCADCRSAERETHQLDALLLTLDEQAAVPTELVKRIDGRLRQAHRRRLIVRSAAAVAAGVLILALWYIRPQPAIEIVEKTPTLPVEITAVRVDFSDEVLAVPQKTDSPNVVFYWVYPNLASTTSPEGSP